MLNVKSTSALAIVSIAIAGGSLVSAQVGQNPEPLNAITSLPPVTTGDPTPKNPPLISQVAVPEPENLADFVQDKGALLKLGKALFWDQQLGSDGIQSCASCHFKAGADNRSKNQISPGLLALAKDITFQAGGPNYQLTGEDFPFFKLEDENNRLSRVKSDTNDIASSQGVFSSTLINTVAGQAMDNVTYTVDPDGFIIGGIDVRRVEPRNTPTVINTIFNKLQFLDGRAKESFNGVNINGQGPNPINSTDGGAKVYKAVKNNALDGVTVALNNSSLASLVTGPPQSISELSAAGRNLHNIGGKFLARRGKKSSALRPLANQMVDPQDSVLGADSSSPNPGLTISTYDALIQQAFKPEWWSVNNKIIQVNSDGTQTVLNIGKGVALLDNQFTLQQYNFGLFAGLAIQSYLSTLVSDQTPFDKFQAGDITALTAQEQKGLTVFVNTAANKGGNCNTCHTMPEFTRASVRRTSGVASTDSGNPLITVGANGFIANYGIRPASDDPGAGNTTPPGGSNFKVPTLRNIGSTAPYMHNGGKATLEQVVDFYNRGRGDAGTAPAGGGPLELSATKKADLVAFLRNGLTDTRVLYEKAPFDHPQLFIPNGHPGNQLSVASRGNTNGTPIATDQLMEIPAVGKNGVTAPQPNFLGLP